MEFTKYPEVFLRKDRRVEEDRIVGNKIEALIRAMTFEEKCSMVAGAKEPEDKGKIGNAGYQLGVPRLGVPEVVMYDGPAGITGIVDTTGLPQPSLLGCTWDEEMAYQFGQVAGTEASACSGNFLLSPQVDVIRSPHFFRNKDMKSEDSFLAAKLGTAETKGVQDAHVVGTLKHLVAANAGHPFDNPPARTIIDEQMLHENYLRPFEEAILKGHAGSVMNAYNIINDDHMTANTAINIGVLRGMWGFKGSIMSDWGAAHQFTLNKGLDIEMPYPAYNDMTRVARHLQRGDFTWEELDNACRHVLYGMSVAGLLSLVELDGDGNVKVEAGRTAPIQMEWYYEEAVRDGLLATNAEKAEQIVREGIVLMKNDNRALPLTEDDLGQNLILTGVGAKYPICGESQERSFGRLERMIEPAAALEELTGQTVPVYAGIDFAGEAIPAEYLYQDSDCSKTGVKRTQGILQEERKAAAEAAQTLPVEVLALPGGGGMEFVGAVEFDEDGEIVDTGLHNFSSIDEKKMAEPGKLEAIDPQIDFTCGTKNYQNGENGTAFTDGASYTWKGYLKAPEDGEYTLLLECIGGEGVFLLQVDGQWLPVGNSQVRECTQWPWDLIVNTPEGMGITGREMTLEKDKVYPLIVFARQAVRNKDLQIRLAWSTPSQKTSRYDDMIQAVSEADTVVYYACDSWNTKSMLDMVGFGSNPLEDIELPRQQEAMLEDAIAHRKPGGKFIVVLQTSGAKAIGKWADQVDAILCTYLPGQEGSRVIAEILTGRTNPSGKLSQTWPARSVDTPESDNEQHLEERQNGIPGGENKIIRMSEGIFSGYRWYDKEGIKPLFAFGHGLSYTDFVYSDLKIKENGAEYLVSLNVENTGDVSGDEVVQLYLGAAEVPAHIQMAERQLAGFARVKDLAPGESRRVEIPIEERSLCYWDPAMVLQPREDGTKDKWVRTVGKRAVYVGASSRDIRLTGEISL